MKSIFKIIATTSVIFCLTACKSTVPINDVEGFAMPAAAKTLSNREIGETISKALLKRRFYCRQVTDNQLTCTIDTRGHIAELAIDYTQKEFSIHHISTSNLSESAGKIHPKYNQWVKIIKFDILEAIANKR